jgi:two-component sensor histidine kinase
LKSILNIDIFDIIKKLTANLFSLYEAKIIPVKLNIEIKDIFLDTHKAIPCCLIVSELVSNSIRYAFPEGRSGELAVKMSKDEQGTYALTVKDDGIGLPKGLDWQKSSTCGFNLIKTLVNQIDGAIEFYDHKGTEFTIKF